VVRRVRRRRRHGRHLPAQHVGAAPHPQLRSRALHQRAAAGLNTALGAPPPGAAFFVALGLVAAGLWLQTRARSN
jgi:hypothetical protein